MQRPISKRWLDICAIGLLFFVALTLRLTYQRESVIDHPIRADAREYFFAAYNLHRFQVYSTRPSPPGSNVPPEPDFKRPPGYPLFLYPFIASSREAPQFLHRVGVAQAILGALTVVLAYALARLFLGIPFSTAAGLLTSLSPHLIAMDHFVLSESLFTFILVTFALCISLSWRYARPSLAFVSGGVSGWLILIRPIALLLGPFVGVIFLLHRKQPKLRFNRLVFYQISCLLLGYCAVYGSYLYVKNATTTGPIQVSHQPIWKKVVNGFDIRLSQFVESKYNMKLKKEREKMWKNKSYALDEFKERFLRNPLEYIQWYLGGKLFFMWRWDNIYIGDVYQYPMTRKGFEHNRVLSLIHTSMQILHWPLYVVSLISLPIAWVFRKHSVLNGKRSVWVLMACFVYFAFLLTVLTPLPRYALPVRPFSYIMAMFSVLVLGKLLVSWTAARKP